MYIYKKEKLGPAMWVMRCPKCGKIQASASERGWLPESTYCPCDKEDKANKGTER